MSKEVFSKNYNIWLITILTIIPIMVLVGGYTRLTDSGLSITEWALFKGILPPLSHDDWQDLFAKYQEIPQFIINNPNMDVYEFKNIFWLEYIHRILGRVIGLLIIIPALAFYIKGKINIKQKQFIITISLLVILQGFLGWFMVSSGLSELTSVSHYRLSIHLLLAFIIYSIVTNHYFIGKLTKDKYISKKQNYKILKIFQIILILQIIYGAFVAGLDAGLIYNQYPLMGENFYPQEILDNNIIDIFLNEHATIQFIHRILALILVAVAFYMVRRKLYENLLIKILLALILAQFIVGIITLLTIVNMHIAILHQLTALFLFSVTNLTIKLCKK